MVVPRRWSGDDGGDDGVMVMAVALVAIHFRQIQEEKVVHIYYMQRDIYCYMGGDFVSGGPSWRFFHPARRHTS